VDRKGCRAWVAWLATMAMTGCYLFYLVAWFMPSVVGYAVAVVVWLIVGCLWLHVVGKAGGW